MLDDHLATVVTLRAVRIAPLRNARGGNRAQVCWPWKCAATPTKRSPTSSKRDPREPFCNGSPLVKVATAKVDSPQCPQRPQLSVHLLQGFGGFKRLCQSLPCTF